MRMKDELSFWSRVYKIGYGFLDKLTFGHLTLRRRNIELASRLAMKEAENEGLIDKLGEADREIEEKDERIGGLEEELEEQRIKLVQLNEDYQGLSSSLEAFMMDNYQEFNTALNEVRELHRKLGTDIDDITLIKGVLTTVQYQRKAVKEANKKVAAMEEKVAEAERKGILVQVAMEVGEIKTPIIVLDGNNRIKAMSKSAVELVSYDATGKQASHVFNKLYRMIANVLPTYENGFYVDNLFSDSRLHVHMKRTAKREYIGAILVAEKRKGWLQRSNRTQYDSLNQVVSEAVADDKNIPIDLRKAIDIPDEFVKRLYGLSLSGFFKKKTKIVVNNSKIYDKLVNYGVPKDMVVYAAIEETKKNPEKSELGLEGAITPSPA